MPERTACACITVVTEGENNISFLLSDLLFMQLQNFNSFYLYLLHSHLYIVKATNTSSKYSDNFGCETNIYNPEKTLKDEIPEYLHGERAQCISIIYYNQFKIFTEVLF